MEVAFGGIDAPLEPGEGLLAAIGDAADFVIVGEPDALGIHDGEIPELRLNAPQAAKEPLVVD